MNRPIKFRGLKPESTEWVHGDLLLNNGEPIIVKQVNRDYIQKYDAVNGAYWSIDVPAFKVSSDSIGQFTGLTDKNGKDIYEGDIVKYSHEGTCHNYVGKIVYKPAEFCIEIVSSSSFRATSHMMLINDSGVTSNEVIGNIHENPELLS